MMKHPKLLIGILVFTIAAVLFLPAAVLYLSEDLATDALHDRVLKLLDEKRNTSKDALISAIYAKYSDIPYTISTYDEFQYALPVYKTDENVFVNQTLKQLQQLEQIGLIKQSYFAYLAANKQMISRTNEYQGEGLHYSKVRIFLAKDQFETAVTAYEIENNSEAIISLKMPKQYVTLNQTVLQNYIDYLALAADDWVYYENAAVSKSQRIEIKAEVIHDMISVSLMPHPYD